MKLVEDMTTTTLPCYMRCTVSGGRHLRRAGMPVSAVAFTIARQVRYEETLKGFNWIANRAMELERDGGYRFVFGYEEALGYTVGDVVRHKDGVSAALVFSELAAKLAAEGRTVQAELEAIHRKFGLFVSSQVNVTRKG